MKKKFREITVGEKTYAWAIKKNTDGDDKSKFIHIWYEKKIVHKQKLDSEEITPSVVKKIIERKNL